MPNIVNRILVLSLVVLAAPLGGALANPTILTDWRAEFPTSTTDEGTETGCQVCHQSRTGGDPWNAYGWDIREFLQANTGAPNSDAFQSVQSLDSDGNGDANSVEIAVGSQPGWTGGADNSIFFKNGDVLTGQTAPTDIVGDLDPGTVTEPDIALVPASLDFGVVEVGFTRTSGADIFNNGTASLDVTAIDLCAGTSGEFSVTPSAPFSVAAVTSLRLSISYAPADAGTDSGCLEISSNDPDQPIVTLALNGEGVVVAPDVLDVDIVALNVAGSIDLDLGGSVSISLSAVNNGTVSGFVSATVTGVQNGGEIYSETAMVPSGDPGASTTIPFSGFTPGATGTIAWTATLADDDPDLDEATALTDVFSSSLGVAVDNPHRRPIHRQGVQVDLETVATGLVAPTQGVVAPGQPEHLYVVDQPGQVWRLDLAGGGRTLFMDVGDQLVNLGIFGPDSFDERGLLGLAFHPDFETNGLLYTYTSEPLDGDADFSTMPAGIAADHHTVIAEWRLAGDGSVDMAAKRVLLRIDQPQFNHNGGTVAFGPDGLLYISVGDGGGADDVDGQPFIDGDMVGHGSGNGQDATNPLGAILRIDPGASDSANGQYGIPADNPFIAAGDARLDEIYAYGFRNPFRVSFDTGSGVLYAADVGQNDIEEIDIVVNGGNYGWNLKEGSFVFDPNGVDSGFVTDGDISAAHPDLIDPIASYDHDEGISVTGGFVYRGATIPALDGRYVFADWSSSFTVPSGRLFYLNDRFEVTEIALPGNRELGIFVHGFGQDAVGEIYVLGNAVGVPFGETGVVYRLSPRSAGARR